MRIDKGLDLHRPDAVTADEMAAFRAAYERSHGGVLDAYEFWLENDPRVVKSHRLQAFYTASDEGRSLPLHGTLGFLHLYTVMAYDFGIAYEVNHARTLGASKKAVLQTIELAFIHSGPRGIGTARQAAKSILDDWPDADADTTNTTGSTGATEGGADMSAAFPPGWSAEPDLFRIDLDLTTAALSETEMAAIRSWYIGLAGEVPGHVEFLAAGRPGLLKAHLDRMCRAMQGPLPKQMLAFLLLQLSVARANPAGIRESALLGRGLGMTTDQLFEAAGWGAMYGGLSALTLAHDAAADVFGLRSA
jgi:hypothetical protein